MNLQNIKAKGELPLTSSAPRSTGSPWAIVLAGGIGTRMQAAITRLLGEPRPKQFCSFMGSRTMLQHTLDRTMKMVAPDRIVTVVREGQERWLADALSEPLPGRVVVQPYDLGTGGAVYAALAAISERDPHATVVILPSDHFVSPERAFVRDVIHGCLFAEHVPGGIVLLAARPDAPETDYGWIGPGEGEASHLSRFLGRRPARVRHFVEKPGIDEAVRLQRRGYLWNTGIAAARADALWALGRAVLGRGIAPFESLRARLARARRDGAPGLPGSIALRGALASAAPIDFAADICQHPDAARNALVLPLRDVTWSDWGRPERLEATIAQHAAERQTCSAG